MPTGCLFSNAMLHAGNEGRNPVVPGMTTFDPRQGVAIHDLLRLRHRHPPRRGSLRCGRARDARPRFSSADVLVRSLDVAGRAVAGIAVSRSDFFVSLLFSLHLREITKCGDSYLISRAGITVADARLGGVVASAAKQSRARAVDSGLLRRLHLLAMTTSRERIVCFERSNVIRYDEKLHSTLPALPQHGDQRDALRDHRIA
jgi:hypothetical protein